VIDKSKGTIHVGEGSVGEGSVGEGSGGCEGITKY
jgi:hypothetical protein